MWNRLASNSEIYLAFLPLLPQMLEFMVNTTTSGLYECFACICAHRDQKKILNPLRLELQMCRCWELKLGSLQEHPVLLRDEPLIQPFPV